MGSQASSEKEEEDYDIKVKKLNEKIQKNREKRTEDEASEKSIEEKFINETDEYESELQKERSRLENNVMEPREEDETRYVRSARVRHTVPEMTTGMFLRQNVPKRRTSSAPNNNHRLSPREMSRFCTPRGQLRNAPNQYKHTYTEAFKQTLCGKSPRNLEVERKEGQEKKNTFLRGIMTAPSEKRMVDVTPRQDRSSILLENDFEHTSEESFTDSESESEKSSKKAEYTHTLLIDDTLSTTSQSSFVEEGVFSAHEHNINGKKFQTRTTSTPTAKEIIIEGERMIRPVKNKREYRGLVRELEFDGMGSQNSSLLRPSSGSSNDSFMMEDIFPDQLIIKIWLGEKEDAAININGMILKDVTDIFKDILISQTTSISILFGHTQIKQYVIDFQFPCMIFPVRLINKAWLNKIHFPNPNLAIEEHMLVFVANKNAYILDYYGNLSGPHCHETELSIAIKSE